MVSRKEKETIKKELDRAKQEQASASIGMNRSGEFRFPTFRLGSKKGQYKLVFFLVVIIFVLMAVIAGIWKLSFADKASVRTSSYLEQMKDLSSLATSQAFVKIILEKEDNEIFGKEIQANIPGTKRKILLVVPGSVTAGVNLENIASDQLEINEDKKEITLKLPHAQILQDPSIDFEKVETYSLAGIFREDVDWNEGYALANEAKEEIKKEAINQGILTVAETNAKKTLKSFCDQLGYSVHVTFSENEKGN
ncbi:DUF4230 domain-containing protein [Niallia sp. 03133]|uniref:DUF4230 domain-containing protein n=1 Tax=Niallia sp. 03133 TaxID=3458060 RepID=UPI00404501B2